MIPHFSQSVYDMVRGMTFTMFVIILFQVGFILVHYFRVLRLERAMGNTRIGLLPLHVIGVSVTLIYSLAECALQNAARIGEPPNYFWYSNPPLFILAIWSLQMVMTFEARRYRYSVSDLNPGE